ncbi:TPA_asm: L [Euphorbia alphacytorhabdovirus 1]|nr:TPA_asm: L [Euphorbia alphacytorhabdovirus 1]
MDYLNFVIEEENGNSFDHQNNKFDNLPDFHLRNPLHPMSYLSKHSREMPKRLRLAIEALKTHRRNLLEGDPIDLIIEVTRLIPPSNRSKLYESIGDAMMRLSLDEAAINSIDGLEMEVILTEATKEINLFLWDAMRFWNEVMLTMNAISSRRPQPLYATPVNESMSAIRMNEGANCYITSSIIAFETDESLSRFVCYDSDWVRMVSDLWTQRFLLNLATIVGNKLNSVVYPPWELIESVINWGDTVLKLFGNEGYKLIKNYEAICVGVLLSRGNLDSIVDNHKFLNSTINDLYLDKKSFGREADKLKEIIASCLSPHHITQLYGLHRLWGHPIVDSQKGMEKVRDIGKKNISRDVSVGVDASRYFKMNFCREYRKKYRKYPNIKLINSRLHDLIQANDPGALSCVLIEDREWDDISFSKTYSIPETFNLSMVVSDKAISLTKSELIRNIRTRKSIMNPEKRRGVLRWINDTTVKPKEFLQAVNDGIFPEDQKIIGLTPKERELNPTPRMFALMSHLLRIYVVVTEQMLSEHILPMFPQITMTDSLLDLTKKTYAVAKRQSPSLRISGKGKLWASRTVCVSLDFEKWNGHMRKESTEPIFTCLGDLFGMTNLYNATYDLFADSYLYLADGSYIPEIRHGELIEDGSLSFSGHKGGMEGLRQKGWTIFTVCCLDMVCSRYNCTYKIMGMGDNQVLQITVFTYAVDGGGNPTDKGKTEMRGIIETLFQDLIETFGNLGLPLKPLETWMSEDLHLYGKYPIWRGVPLCMDLKKTMRMFAYSNDDIMTLENALGTIYGNAASATQGTCFTIVPYVIGIIMSSLCVMDFFDYHPFLGEGLNKHLASDLTWKLMIKGKKSRVIPIGEHGMNDSMIRMLMQIVPRTLGGYNSLNIYELMMRGFPDNLSRDLSYLYKIRSAAPSKLKQCVDNWIRPLYMPTRNYQLLIEDVSSVNIISPRTPISGIRQTVEKFISDPKRIRNPEFRDLMSGKIQDQAKSLADHLCEGDDLHIRLLHDIYESTIIGYIDSILSKVTKSSTIQRLAVSKSSFDSMSAVFKDEINCFRFFVWRCSIDSGESIANCPTTHAKNMRRRSWGKSLRGVTTPFPLSYLKLTNCGMDKVCSCDDGYISIHFPDKQINEFMWNTSIGRNPPYLGSMTKEKVITGLVGKAYSTEPLIRRPLKLMRVINWYVPPDSNTADVIRSTVKAISDTNPDLYEGKLEGTAGAEVHRYRDTSLKHGALTSSNYLYPTRYHISTDNFTRYSKGGENYDVHFQACLCSIVEQTNIWITKRNRHGELINKFQHYAQSCYECVNIVDETFVDLPSKEASSIIPHRKNNSYLYVRETDIQDALAYSPLLSLKLPFVTNQMYQLLTELDKYNWLIDTLADLIASDICSGSQSESFFTIGLTDIKAYERTMFLKMNPLDLFSATIDRLKTFAKWRCSSRTRLLMPSETDVIRFLDGYLISVEADSMSGLAMIYGWEETYRRMKFDKRIILPNTVPASLSSSCEAVRKTLINLSRSKDQKGKREFMYFTEDVKNNRFIHKLMLSDYTERISNCVSCIRTIHMNDPEFLIQNLYALKCEEGHHIFSSRVKIYQSHVTVERLRKDGKAKLLNQTEFNRQRLSPIVRTTVKTLLDFGKLRQRQINWNCQLGEHVNRSKILGNRNIITNITSLRKLYTLPTAANYKYLEIFSHCLDDIKGKNIFLLGDGLGSTSQLLSDMTDNNILVSTLLETDDAMPQSYPHLVQPTSIFDNKTNIDRSQMVNKVNNIDSEGWHDDWRDAVDDYNAVISDIEIIDKSQCYSRDNVIKKILSLRDWEMAIIKDYIYDLNELYGRLRFILSKVKRSVRLISIGTKTPGLPEMWWIIKKTDCTRDVQLTYDPRSILYEWNDLVDAMDSLDRTDVPKLIMDEMNARISVNNSIEGMISLIRVWATLPLIGCALPENGNYTNLFYRLSCGKRPAQVHLERDSKSLRMYTKDHYRVREVLFGLAVGMLANITDRERIINESENWLLDWEIGKSTSDWYPYLYRTKEHHSAKIKIDDYIPILSCLMIQSRLSFGKIGQSVRFKQDNIRKKDVFFPISSTANLKIKSKGKSSKR